MATATARADTVWVVPAGEGTAAVTVTATDPGGASAEQSFTLSVGPDPQRLILEAFYESTGGDQWTKSDNWLTDAPLREWHGIWQDGGRVVGLDLPDNNLRGALPAELGNLGGLAFLSLNSNRLTGTIPAELGRLSNLTSLQLADNQLEGPIPAELGRLSKLRHLGLYLNKLTGRVPAELGELSLALSLHVEVNQLEGPLPASFVQLDSLNSLGFNRNATLCAPRTPAFLAWLEGITHYQGPLCGDGDRRVLEAFYRDAGGPDWKQSGGWLGDGDLDDWHGVETDSIGHVAELDLEANGLKGKVTPGLGALAGLTRLEIGENSLLGGVLPQSMTDLPLERFGYAGTRLCAPDDDDFREWLNGIPSVEGTGRVCRDTRDVLERLYNATGGASWRYNDKWLTDAPLDDWFGIVADDNDVIISIVLTNNNLVGSLPARTGRPPHTCVSMDLGKPEADRAHSPRAGQRLGPLGNRAPGQRPDRTRSARAGNAPQRKVHQRRQQPAHRDHSAGTGRCGLP